MLIALTREVSPSINECQLTHLARAPIDLERAREQHREYSRCLGAMGCQVRKVPPAPELPDAVFVEDLAVVLDEIAVLTRPGVECRRPESAGLADVIRPYRLTCQIDEPGTMDGGDVLRVARTLFVGQSSRTNVEGIAQLERFVAPFDYTVKPIAVTGCLHLKTAVTEVGEGTLLLNPRWVDRAMFAGFQLIECDPTEPFGANALRVRDQVLHAAAWQRTCERMYAHNINVVPVDASELAKAEAGVTCCSIVFRA